MFIKNTLNDKSLGEKRIIVILVTNKPLTSLHSGGFGLTAQHG